jgi:hypothetical protein
MLPPGSGRAPAVRQPRPALSPGCTFGALSPLRNGGTFCPADGLRRRAGDLSVRSLCRAPYSGN